MKTSLTYGAAMAIAGAVLMLLLFFSGFHDSVEKMKSAQWIGSIGGIAIGVSCLTLAMREKRAQFPVEEEWGYGSALGGGVLTGLWGSLFGVVTAYVYFAILNPGFCEVVYQAQVAAMETKGVTTAQIDKLEPMLRKWMSPVAMTAIQFVMGFIWSLVLSLIIAIFLRKRPETNDPADAPPVVG